jgi:pyrroloquinoline quinone (PQQ) biosynthesis protein C
LSVARWSRDHPIAEHSDLVARALEPGASPRAVAEAATELAGLAEEALSGDAGSQRRYQTLMYSLHEMPDPATHAVRQYLASSVYPIEEAHIPCAEAPAAPLAEAVKSSMTMRDRLGSDLARYLFAEEPPRLEAVRIYILHHWYRSRGFWRLLADFAARRDLDCAGVLYANLGDETGGGGAPPHPRLLQRLLVHLELPSGMHDRPQPVEALAYLNNRSRCARTAHPAWGLAALYALEHLTPETHRNIHAMLRRVGVPEPAREFHRLHMTHDAEHAADLWTLVEPLVEGGDGPRIFLTSLRRHRELSRRYFEMIWDQVRPIAEGRGRE